jgi:hypothetical protein
MVSGNFAEMTPLLHHLEVFLHAANLQHGTDGFTSPPKEGMLRIFLPEKSDGFEPANLDTRGQHADHYTTEAAPYKLQIIPV